jgi:hypothetical protein
MRKRRVIRLDTTSGDGRGDGRRAYVVKKASNVPVNGFCFSSSPFAFEASCHSRVMVFGGGGATSGKFISVEVLNDWEDSSPQPAAYPPTKIKGHDNCKGASSSKRRYVPIERMPAKRSPETAYQAHCAKNDFETVTFPMAWFARTVGSK